jgi:hypothetical protein
MSDKPPVESGLYKLQDMIRNAEPVKDLAPELATYRRALEKIIRESDDPGAVQIAHQAITPYTNWIAVDD